MRLIAEYRRYIALFVTNLESDTVNNAPLIPTEN